MSGISFLYQFDLGNRSVDNPGENILSVTSTATGDFDKANLTTESSRHRWRSANVLVAQEIIIKAEQKTKIDTFVLIGHNLSPAAIIKIQANISNSFLAPPITITAVVDIDSENIVICQDFGAEYEYYKVSILDPGNECGFIEIGRIIGGRAFTFVDNEDIVDSYRIKNNDESEKMKTQGFFRQSNENVVTKSLSANFQKLFTVVGKNANFIALRRMYRYIKTTKPFFTILDRDDPTKLNLWGQLTDVPDEAYGINEFVSLPFNQEEVF